MEEKKEIHFGEAADKRLLSGLNKAVKAVGATHGARGRTVLIQSRQHTRGITVTKDGVTVMRAIDLVDPVENLAVQLLRQAASRTVIQAGDGTTTATVLVGSMVNNAKKLIGKNNNIVDVTRYMKMLTNQVVSNLKASSRSIKYGSTELLDVATVSANNDPYLGEIIFNAYTAVGEDGFVSIEKSKDEETYFELVDGIKLERSILSPIHVTNFKNYTCELIDPLIVVSDMRIQSVKNIEKFIQVAINEGKPLFIIGDLDQEAKQTIDLNIQNGAIKAAYIEPPSFGANRTEQLQDIAIALGARYVSTSTGDDWGSVGINALGRAGKVVISRDSTSIHHGDNKANIEATNKRVQELKDKLEGEKSIVEKDSLNERIANLCGKVAIVFVGAKTDAEQKEKRDRVDDSVLATRAALKDGVLPGGGMALIYGSTHAPKFSFLERFFKKRRTDEALAIEIMARSLEAPFHQILSNAGKNSTKILRDIMLNYDSDMGYDVKRESILNMFDAGVIDPTKIVVSALTNATATASDILTNAAVISNYEK